MKFPSGGSAVSRIGSLTFSDTFRERENSHAFKMDERSSTPGRGALERSVAMFVLSTVSPAGLVYEKRYLHSQETVLEFCRGN